MTQTTRHDGSGNGSASASGQEAILVRSADNLLRDLTKMQHLAERAGAKHLGEQIKERLSRLDRGELHLAIVGEFNHGKTSFVNALLEQSLLPTGVTPTTALVHTVRYQAQSSAKLVKRSGTESALSLENLRDYAVGKRGFLEVEASGTGEASGVALDIGIPATILKSGWVLLDTPGLNDLDDQRAERTRRAIRTADLVIMLLDAGQFLKDSERQFLKDELTHLAERQAVLFVINKADLLTPSERTEMQAYAKRELSFFAKNPRIFLVSSLDRGGSVNSDGFDELRRALVNLAQNEKAQINFGSIDADHQRFKLALGQALYAKERALLLEQAQLQRELKRLETSVTEARSVRLRKMDELRERLVETKTLLRRTSEEFGERLARSIAAELEKISGEELQRFLPQYVESRVTRFAEEQIKVAHEKSNAIAKEAVAFLTAEEQTASDPKEALRGLSLPLNVKTFRYDVSVVAVGAVGVSLLLTANILVGGVMAGLAPVMAYVFKGRAERDLKLKLIKELPPLLKQAASKLADALDESLDQFFAELQHQVEFSGEEIARNFLDVVRQVETMRGRGDAELLNERTRFADVKREYEALG